MDNTWIKLSEDAMPERKRYVLISNGDEVCLCNDYLDFSKCKKVWQRDLYLFQACGIDGYEYDVIYPVYWKYIVIGELPNETI